MEYFQDEILIASGFDFFYKGMKASQTTYAWSGRITVQDWIGLRTYLSMHTFIEITQ